VSEWFCRIDGEESGPYSARDLRFLRDRGELHPDDELRRGKSGDWRQARKFSGLFPAQPEQPVAVASEPAVESVPEPDLEATERPEAEEEEQGDQRPPLPTPEKIPYRRTKQIAIGTSIGTAIALLILLLLYPWQRDLGGSRGTVAGRGVGETEGAGLGADEGEGAGEGLAEQEAQGEEAASDEIVEEGVFAEEVLNQGGESSEPPPLDPLEQSGFTIRRVQNNQPQQGENEAGGGGGAGLGEFAERLEREGGKSGEVQITLIWYNVNDLDLHVICPSGEEIDYQRKESRCGGELDVDMNAGGPDSDEPVENVVWAEGAAPEGKYVVQVEHFADHGARDPTEFKVMVRYAGEVRAFSGKISYRRPRQRRTIHEFEL